MSSPYKPLRIPPMEVWHLEHRATYATAVHAALKGRVPFDVLGRMMRLIVHERPAKIVRTLEHWFTVDQTMRARTLPGSDFVAPEEAVFVKARADH